MPGENNLSKSAICGCLQQNSKERRSPKQRGMASC
jgi:hypothetical protein